MGDTVGGEFGLTEQAAVTAVSRHASALSLPLSPPPSSSKTSQQQQSHQPLPPPGIGRRLRAGEEVEARFEAGPDWYPGTVTAVHDKVSKNTYFLYNNKNLKKLFSHVKLLKLSIIILY